MFHAVMNPEHADRRTGYRVINGEVELWFSVCNAESHVGLYFPSCGACNTGGWVPTGRAVPA